MPAPDLKPQIPGEPLNEASTDPQAALRAELEAIAGLNAPEVIDGLATMSPDELRLLHAIETDGKGRVTVLAAIDSALAPPADTETHASASGGTEPQAGEDEVVRKSKQPTSKLTDAGWVVPEPDQKA